MGPGAVLGVSVVIAYYAGLPDLDVQLAALARQDYRGEFEVIVSDNEGSLGLRRHLDEHPLVGALGLRWVDSSDIPGTSHARNVGTRSAVHDFIVYCDQDDAVHPGWLRAMVTAAATADLIGGPLERETLNDPVVASWRALPDPTGPVLLGRHLPMTFGCNLGIRREVFDAVGGWDESYPNAGGDVEFCWRVQTSGYSFGFAPDAMVAYRYRTGIRETFAQVVDYGQEEARVAKQYGAPGRQWWWFVLHAGVVAGLCPVWPWAWSRRRRGEWAWVTGNLVGRIRGSIKYRVLYW
ncbi:glycosyltransferase [Gordonia sp. ABSL1-1]|uniref:glycosyltransferase family 2 protein n=1 Tax=Gordonia sp. ABSL1-1 TaxID=3053923 RepID=UPI00257259DC|nr:glycosyltransferase [Gordonia sp. ABSL1-1]MDL9936849.1 glycosyltransferase [Gordonia sp. ABSL1-1]